MEKTRQDFKYNYLIIVPIPTIPIHSVYRTGAVIYNNPTSS
jgi:hypothetical protein